MAPKLKTKQPKIYATRSDGFRTEWAEQLLKWKEDPINNHGPTIEVYIGAILSTDERSEAALTAKNNATNRRWADFVEAEPVYVKKLRRFANSLRVTDDKHLSAPNDNRREVKLHLYINAERTFGESARRLHGAHGTGSSTAAKRKEDSNGNDEEPPAKKPKRAAMKKSKSVTKGNKIPTVIVDLDEEMLTEHDQGPREESDHQSPAANKGPDSDPNDKHRHLDQPKNHDQGLREESHQQSPAADKGLDLDPNDEHLHNPPKNQDQPAALDEYAKAKADRSVVLEDGDKPPKYNKTKKIPYKDWPVYDDIDKDTAEAFVDAIMAKRNTLNWKGVSLGTLMPWWIVRRFPSNMRDKHVLFWTKPQITRYRKMTTLMREGRWGKCSPIYKTQADLERRIQETLAWEELSISTADAQWIIKKCRTHPKFNARWRKEFWPQYLFDELADEPNPHKWIKGSPRDSGENLEIRDKREKWLQEKVDETLKKNRKILSRWKKGKLGYLIRPDKISAEEEELDAAIQTAQAEEAAKGRS